MFFCTHILFLVYFYIMQMFIISLLFIYGLLIESLSRDQSSLYIFILNHYHCYVFMYLFVSKISRIEEILIIFFLLNFQYITHILRVGMVIYIVFLNFLKKCATKKSKEL